MVKKDCYNATLEILNVLEKYKLSEIEAGILFDIIIEYGNKIKELETLKEVLRKYEN